MPVPASASTISGAPAACAARMLRSPPRHRLAGPGVARRGAGQPARAARRLGSGSSRWRAAPGVAAPRPIAAACENSQRSAVPAVMSRASRSVAQGQRSRRERLRRRPGALALGPVVVDHAVEQRVGGGAQEGARSRHRRRRRRGRAPGRSRPAVGTTKRAGRGRRTARADRAPRARDSRVAARSSAR